jgi:hypothetical protein
MSPKEFLFAKQPLTDVERIACLAYYSSYFRGKPDFKTADLTKLNTEAAQLRFADASNTSYNALKGGYLDQSSKGKRRLSAGGARFVRALPDRRAAKAAMGSARSGRNSR